MGFEPTTTGITIRDSNQLSYAHHKNKTRRSEHPGRTGLPHHTGAPDRNRTCNPQLRRLVLYPVELRAPVHHTRSSLRNAPSITALCNRKMVGVEGFEPPTPCSQSRCATRLRYTPRLRTIAEDRGEISARRSPHDLNREGGNIRGDLSGVNGQKAANSAPWRGRACMRSCVP